MKLLNDIHHLTLSCIHFRSLVSSRRTNNQCSNVGASIISRSMRPARKHSVSYTGGVVAEDASDGVVTDMGSLLLFTFTDPDQGRHEVVWAKPDVPVETGLKRADWTIVEME